MSRPLCKSINQPTKVLLKGSLLLFLLGCGSSGGTISILDGGMDSGTTDASSTSNDSDSSDSSTQTDTTWIDTDSTYVGDSDTSRINASTGEICGNGVDDDVDGAFDCADTECKDDASCISLTEDCTDGVDNDLDLKVDCSDEDCQNQINCAENCSNGVDDDGDGAIDCEDSSCKGIDPSCGEVCGDGIDNDLDGQFDCDDADCADVSPPCGDSTQPDGTMCSYQDSTPHTCECADGVDNDSDGVTDMDDLQCLGPFDDNETEFATGIPGDNEGSKADKECPFDGNSGTGNDDVCCNPADPTQNVTPNGCDDKACCEIDVNGNTTGEHVYVRAMCEYAPSCGDEGKHGCPCEGDTDCDDGQYCVADKNIGPGFCSKCEPCSPNAECENPCSCGETCFGGFTRPPAECGATVTDTDTGTDTTDTDTSTSDTDTSTGTIDTDTSVGSCPDGQTACPGGDANCDASKNETCISGCCYSTCPVGVIPCEVSSDCPESGSFCITGCCIFVPVV